MKNKIFTFLAVILTSTFSTHSQPVTIMDFTCDNTQTVQSTTLVSQMFTIPAGTDYYATQLGIKLDDQSISASIKLAIYNSARELIFVSKELNYPGGTTETLSVDIAAGVLTLSAESSYYISLIHNGSDFLYLKKIESASNDGLAQINEYSHFYTGASYPDFPESITSYSGAWAQNLGFTVEAEEKTTEIETDNEILEFNTVSNMTINYDHIYSVQLKMPAGETHDLRQIGLKKNEGGAGDQIHFAVYDESNNLIHQTSPITIENNIADTIFATIPSGIITLQESTDYFIAFQYDGNTSIDVGISSNPVYRGLATLQNDNSWFSTDQTFTDFPDPLAKDGAYGHAFGFVLNGDTPPVTNIQTKQAATNFSVYPVPVKSKMTITSPEEFNKKLKIVIFDITGKKVLQTQWIGSKAKNINIDHLPEGIYFISLNDYSGRVINHLKILKE